MWGEAIHVSEIARFADAQDHGLEVTVEPPEQVLGRYLRKIPGANGAFDGFKQRVLADALGSTEHQSVVDLFRRLLHPMGKPLDEVVGFARIDLPYMLQPRRSVARPRLNGWGAVQVEHRAARALNPTTFRDQE